MLRGSGWILPLLALLLWTAAVGLPILFGAAMAATQTAPSAEELGMRHAFALWRDGVVWAIGVGVVAALLGWGPGRVLRGLLLRRPATALALGMLLIVPAAMPAYLGSWCWWQLAPPDSAIGGWIIRSGHLWWLRHAILALGLIGWSWPLAAWAVAGLGVNTDRDIADAMRLHGATRLARLRLAWSEDRNALLLAALATGLFAFGNTVAFDIALVRSFGFELRTLEARGAGVGATLRAAWPATVTAFLVITLAWMLLRQVRRSGGDAAVGAGWTARTMTIVVLVVGVAIPLALLLRAVPIVDRGEEFLRFYGRAVVGSLTTTIATAALATIVAAGTLVMCVDRRRWIRIVADATLLGWAVAATVPAIVVAMALTATYNRGVGRTLYDSPMIIVLGHLACFGFVAALLGRQAALAWPRDLHDRAALDGAGSLRGVATSLRPLLVAVPLAAFALTAPMSLGEVTLAGRLQPPGHDAIAAALLNAVHYQRPETVMIGALLLLVFASIAAIAAPLAWLAIMRTRRGAISRGSGMVLCLVVGGLSIAGCAPLDPTTPPPIPTRDVFGRPGVGGGQFDYPRAIATDRERGRVYVVDKSARIQRFDLDGTLELVWQMPEWMQGKPVGLTVAPDGSVWVADTHYYRVVVFESSGVERMRFGEFGSGDGQFIYPTDVAIGRDGRIYVSEYGGNDRIQVFDPTGAFLFSFGSFGSGSGEFSRPQAIAFSEDGTELFVADSCNHRIVVCDPEGNVLRSFGRLGNGIGELGYPYGIEPLADGTLLVMEFGNCRLQRFSREGESIGMWGGIGFDVGRVRAPWGVAAASGTIFVLDSGNHRVQAMRRP